MALLGIDLNSRKLAWCRIEGTDMSHYMFEVHGSITNRAQILATLYEVAIDVAGPGDICYIETPIVAGARNIQSTIKCAAAYGVVVAALQGVHATPVDVAVSSWKVAILGKGNASKLDVSDWLHNQHPSAYRECSGDQDLMDATCIALYGLKESGDRGDVLPAAEDAQDPRHGRRRD